MEAKRRHKPVGFKEPDFKLSVIHMNIQQLRYIVALDRFRNFARAAEACDVSQPTLSAMLVRLEIMPEGMLTEGILKYGIRI